MHISLIKNLISLFICVAILGVQQLSAQHSTDSITLTKTQKVPAIQEGIASFYHDKFEGRTTSNGSIFTQKKMTAASNKYPLNCWVKVINLSNNNEVYVKITDRMHPKNTRLIDLSKAAASQLKYLNKGLTKVRVEYMGKKEPLIKTDLQ